MVKSEIFFSNVYLDNTPKGRAVMIRPLLVFLTHPNRQFICTKYYIFCNFLFWVTCPFGQHLEFWRPLNIADKALPNLFKISRDLCYAVSSERIRILTHTEINNSD